MYDYVYMDESITSDLTSTAYTELVFSKPAEALSSTSDHEVVPKSSPRASRPGTGHQKEPNLRCDCSLGRMVSYMQQDRFPHPSL